MQKLLLYVDKVSTFAGRFFSWSIMGLTFLISWEVFSRYVLNTLSLSILRWKPEHILLGLLLVSYILPHVFILSEDRFHLALIPYIAILASQVWVNGRVPLRVHWNESHIGKIMVVLALCAALLLLTNWGLELNRDADKIAQLLSPTGNHSYFPY